MPNSITNKGKTTIEADLTRQTSGKSNGDIGPWMIVQRNHRRPRWQAKMNIGEPDQARPENHVIKSENQNNASKSQMKPTVTKRVAEYHRSRFKILEANPKE